MPVSAENLTIEKAIVDCLLDAESQRAAHTAKTYENALRVFKIFLEKPDRLPPCPAPDTMLSKLDVEYFIHFPAWIARTGKYSHSTVTLYMSGVKWFYDWLTIQGYIDPSHNEDLRYGKAIEMIHRKREEKKPRTPKEGDAEKVKNAAYRMEVKEIERLRNIALVEFLYSSGCRAFEAASLHIADIDLERRQAQIIGKGTGGMRSQVVGFSSESAEAFRDYWKARGDYGRNAPAFARHDKGAGRLGEKLPKAITTRTVHYVVIQCAKLAGLDPHDFHPHSFRHAFVKRVLTETGNLALAQDLARHKTPNTTRVYSTIEEEEKMAAHHRIFH